MGDSRPELLKSELKNRILVLDGAMGTALQQRNLTAADFGGEALEGCNENLILTRPDVIQDITREYLEAGCDIVETGTFGATPLVLSEYDLQDKAHAINFEAARIARAACDKYSTARQPRFVAGSMGPTTKAISVTGGITFSELISTYKVQAQGLIEGGVDYLLLETCQDTRNIKAGLIAIDEVQQALGTSIPVAVSATIEPMGTMLAGQSVEALTAALSHRDLLYVGLNCATGPEFMTDHIRSLAGLAPFNVACVPNAGLPDENGNYLESPAMIAAILKRFVDQGWINLLGGCCGTTPAHIKVMAELAKTVRPRQPRPLKKSLLSGIDVLEITQEMRPVLVGERTNVIGSKKFKDLIAAEQHDTASEVARAQIKGGAHLIDVCLANPDRDEYSDMELFLKKLMPRIRCAVMIDSTDARVLELGLEYNQGKAIINSINLEDGEERFEAVVPLMKKYGAAAVVGTIDDDPVQGMGVTPERKLEIARREYALLTKKYGIPATDIYWDPLVFPCGTGDAQYVGSAAHTIEGIRLLKQEFPETKTVLGISNVSFGLPPAGREVLNSVFLYHCVQAGLDLAIVNTEKLVRFAQIPEEERILADNLLFNRGPDPVTAFANHFRARKAAQAPERRLELPLDQRLALAIVEGSKAGLIEDLEEARQTRAPLEIINGPLMKGMDEVGRLFNDNKLIVAEVLQSAEVMKAAVAHLEQFMEKSEATSRGKIMLATVKGDVHDIGKNLVDIILSNNGFTVVDLGIKVTPEKLIESARQHKPDIIGLSGLLVKSAQQMIVTADDLSRAGVQVPMLVGGAALTESFVDRQVSPAYAGTVAYASDAMSGLDLAKTIMDPGALSSLQTKLSERRERLPKAAKAAPAAQPINTSRSTDVEVLSERPRAQDRTRHIVRNTPVVEIWKYINPLMLYGRHLGVKGGIVRKLQDPLTLAEVKSTDPKTYEVWKTVEEIKEEYRDTDVFRAAAVFQFLKAHADGNRVVLEKAAFEFPRQRQANGLCLSDYVYPNPGYQVGPEGPQYNDDEVALFVVTVGKGIRELAENLKTRGAYLKSHVVQALAIESAEAYAELLHAQIRRMWGFGDPPETTMMDRFQAKYRGKRYSFGYPACPRLDDQKILFDLLKPEEIGVQLTEGFMMDPEASVSAIVFHHPQAKYFSVGSQEAENRG